ncbi:MAG: glycosyltransferase family 2 protein, partial [Thalassotalea sp.]|nr:glycosyltransferase family 2 protein [Thalassotalea sp.]
MKNVEKSSPFYSVIIPSYNRSCLIQPTIESILEQSCQDFEVIIVDDFSSDIAELEALVLSFNDKRIKLFKHDKNKNGAAARN